MEPLIEQKTAFPRWHFSAAIVLVFCCFFLGLDFLGAPVGAGQIGSAQQAANKPATTAPVILLTGFEPFGTGRPPNPSWEGIKELDGQPWKGYRLVCKQLPVVWGAPLEQLEGWIKQYQPVGIFSFGQGSPGSFALESLASNDRRRRTALLAVSATTAGLMGSPLRERPILAASLIFPGRGLSLDNRGEYPLTPTIVADGPKHFRASADCRAFARVLSEKGHPTRVSRAAGRYLCEEALYSLEYLKSTKQLDATVMFCHVPPLDTEIGGALRVLAASTIGLMGPGAVERPLLAASALFCGKTLRGKPVTAEDVQEFVKDALETWYTLYQAQTSVSYQEQRKADDPRHKEITDFIGRYFSSWSRQDMKGYDACFLPDASIQYIDEEGQLSTHGRKQFIASQTEYHKKAAVRATEAPESIDIRFEAKLARVVVFWKLTAGPRTEMGYDHFTLMKQGGNWRIVNLTFYPSTKIATD